MLDRLKQLFQLQQAVNQDNQGLLTNQNTQATGGLLGGLTSNPNLILGASIIGQGVKGQDPFSSVVPALTQTASIQKAFGRTGFRQLSDAEKKAKGLPVDKQFQIDLKTKKISQIGGSGTNVNVNTSDPTATPLKIRKQYQEESKPFITRKESRNAILSNTQLDFDERTPADDFTLIYKYYKFVDPGSVVKESEFENLEKIGSAGDKIKRIVPKFTKGTTLTKKQVKNLEKAMEREFPTYIKDQTERERIFKSLMNQGNYDLSIIQSYIPNKNEKEIKSKISNISTEELLKALQQNSP